jgi:hypothetical protein
MWPGARAIIARGRCARSDRLGGDLIDAVGSDFVLHPKFDRAQHDLHDDLAVADPGIHGVHRKLVDDAWRWPRKSTRLS